VFLHAMHIVAKYSSCYARLTYSNPFWILPGPHDGLSQTNIHMLCSTCGI